MQKCLEGISKYNEYTELLTEYTEDLIDRAGDKNLDYFAKLRGFNIDTVKAQRIFYIGEATEMLLPDYIDVITKLGVISNTNHKPIFHNRFVMPIMDRNGKVLNLVGYSKEANERYVYGTSKYYRRTDTLYGLENLEMAYDLGYAFLTEGITDTIRLRSMGYLNSFANCGTHSSVFNTKLLNRCRHGVIEIPDRDAAGLRASKGWKFNRSVTLNTYIKYKDIDSMCFNESENIQNMGIIKAYIDACIDWILSGEHRNIQCACQEATIFL